MTRPPIRVLVVDDHPVVRMGLVALLGAEPGFEVAGEAKDGDEAIARHAELTPDLTLMDLRLPGVSGLEAITRIRERAPEARIVVLTTYDADEDIFRALAAGARGYLLKGTFREGLLEALRAVDAGQRWIPDAVAARLRERTASVPLTPRETELLELAARGLSNPEIARLLKISEFTVKNHLKKIFLKLDASDRTEAVFAALQRGIIRLPD